MKDKLIDVKAGQLRLFSIVGPKEHLVLILIKKFSISTAEELIAGIRSGLTRPPGISESDWNELIQKAEEALPKETVDRLRNPKPFPMSGGVMNED